MRVKKNFSWISLIQYLLVLKFFEVWNRVNRILNVLKSNIYNFNRVIIFGKGKALIFFL